MTLKSNIIKISKYIILAGLIGISFFDLSAQIAKEFWFAPPKLSGSAATKTYKLYITTMREPAHVSIYVGSTVIANNYLIKKEDSTVVYTIPYTTIDSSLAGQYRSIHIKSCEYIQVFCEAGSNIASYFCRDNYSLKGTNALGTSFVVPGQKYWSNSAAGYTASLHIVSASNINNTITIRDASGTAVAGSPFVLPIGRTYTYSSGSVANHLSGYTITSTGGNFAVTWSDESVAVLGSSTMYDNIGDQLIPVSKFKKEYIVCRGRSFISPDHLNPISDGSFSGEVAYVVSPTPGTVLIINGRPKAATIAANQVDSIQIDYNSMYITANNNIGVFHITGQDAEVGGAMVPPIDYIANQCTGSTEVFMYLPLAAEGIAYLSLIVPKGAEDGFYIDWPDGVSSPVSAENFQAVPSTNDWMVLKAVSKPSNTILASLRADYTKFLGKTLRIRNIYNLFHFGYYVNHQISIIKGIGYQYFSSFSPETSDNKYAYISHVIRNNQYIDVQSKNYTSCVGDTLLLSAMAGKEYFWTYMSGTTTYLDYPTQPNPKVISLPENTVHKFYIDNTRSSCFGSRRDTITITTSTALWARFMATVTQGCSPINTSLLDSSMGANITIRNYFLSYRAPLDTVHDSLFNAAPLQQEDIILSNKISSTELIDTIKMVITNNVGCQDSITRLVTVYPELEGYIKHIPVTQACDSFSVSFADSIITKGSFTWKWDFGDGATNVSSQAPTHIFRNQGQNDTIFQTNFYTTSFYGCKDTDSVAFTIYPYVKASFGVDTSKGCGPINVTINNAAIGPVNTYTWSFGDGTANSNSSASVLTHLYNNISASDTIYTLKQKVTNNHNCADSLMRNIQVYPNVTATFVKPAPLIYCSPQQITYTGPVNTAPVSYQWEFGDSIGSPLKDPTHTYRNRDTNSVTYRTKLKVTSLDNCIAYDSIDLTIHDEVEAIFSIDKSDGCANEIFKITNISRKGSNFLYSWDFDDGSALNDTTDSVFNYSYTNTTLVPQTHNLSLTVRNDKNCTSSVTHPITIYPLVTASFTVNTVSGCNPLAVVFTNTTNTAVTSLYKWDFGDGSTSFLYSPGKTYYNSSDTGATYTARMIAVSDYACADTVDTIIQVSSYIKAAFSMDKSAGCSPLTINFSDNSIGGVQKKYYNYGNGNSDTILTTNFSKLFTNKSVSDTITNIFMRVYNEDNCTDSTTLPLSVYPEVQANFTASGRAGCQPYAITFTNTSNAVASTYNWYFGDGQTSSDTNAVNIFANTTANDTVYTTRMIASSQHSCKDTMDITDTVYAFIEANYKLSRKGICSGDSIKFTLKSSPGNTDYMWDFENDATTDLTYTKATQPDSLYHPYPTNAGPDSMAYTVALIVKNNHTCYDTLLNELFIYPYVIADFVYDSAGCSPHYTNIVNASSSFVTDNNWSFSDNTSSSELNPQKIFLNNTENHRTDSITLIVSSKYSCKDTITKRLTVHSTPIVFVEPDTIMHCSPFLVTFTNKSTANAVTTYYWDYADGIIDSTFNKNNTTHTYTTNRVDSITMRNVQVIAVTQNTTQNCSDTGYSPVYIYPLTIARFGVDPASCAPYIANFSDSSINARYYHWDFGDSQTSFSNSPQHLFSIDGTFIITLITSSDYACKDTVQDTVTVYATPKTDFLIEPIYQRYPNATVTVYNKSTDANGIPIFSSDPTWSFLLEWGDNSDSTTTLIDSTTHTYATWNPAGEQYPVTLSISDTTSTCDTSITRYITILPPFPVAKFLKDTAGCPPFTMNFVNESQFATGYIWDFGDGSPTETTINPSHSFTEMGLYNVQLIALGEDNVRDAYYRTVRAYNIPKIKFFIEPKEVQYPDAVINAVDSTTAAETYHWHLELLVDPFGYGDFDTVPYDTVNSKTFSYTFRDTSKYGTFLIWLEAESDSSCPSISDTQSVLVNPTAIIKFPNAFTPNLDGPVGGNYNPRDISNDIFFPYVPGDRTFLIATYHLEIFSRWGILLYTSDDLNIGWDGYYKGDLCKQDVYVYKCKGTYINGQKFEFAGDITLLHKTTP